MADVEKSRILSAITVIAFKEHFVSDVLHQCVLMWNDYSAMSLFKSRQMDYVIGLEQREMHWCVDSEQSIYPEWFKISFNKETRSHKQ